MKTNCLDNIWRRPFNILMGFLSVAMRIKLTDSVERTRLFFLRVPKRGIENLAPTSPLIPPALVLLLFPSFVLIKTESHEARRFLEGEDEEDGVTGVGKKGDEKEEVG